MTNKAPFCHRCGDKIGPFRAWSFTPDSRMNCIPCSVLELDEQIVSLQIVRHNIDLERIAQLEDTVEQLLFKNDMLERKIKERENNDHEERMV